MEDDKKVNEAAKELSKLGASKGGHARAQKLSPEERSEIARHAVQARWEKAGIRTEQIPQATHSGVLKLGNFEIPCHVLQGGERILSTRGIMKSLGRTWRGRKYSGTQYPVFLEAKNLKAFIPDDLDTVLNPRHFLPKTGHPSEGFNAEILPIVCETYLRARDAGKLTQQQITIAKNCEILVRGLSRIGIIALVDEATGYQYDRARNALEEILEQFITKELRKWVKTFPNEFYELMFKLKGWQYLPVPKAKPSVVGKYTNDLIYARLAPGVLQELKRLTPKDEKGRHKQRLFQRLTEDVGHPRLREHLAAVIALMRASSTWKGFYSMVQRAFPKYEENLSFAFDDIEPIDD